MNKLECLEDEAYNKGIDVVDYNFNSDHIKGLYADGVIALNKKLDTTKEKICILAEELGHHETFAGNILDTSVSANRKQEYKARIWAYRKIISPDDLLSAFKSGCRNRYEIAEHIGVTEEFLEEALACFKTKYPEGLIKASYMIRFTPSLQIFMRFE